MRGAWRVLSYAFSLLCVTALSGCWDAVEMNELAISICASIDVAPHGRVLFSEQVAAPSAMAMGALGPSGGGAATQPYFSVGATGLDIRDAIQRLQMQLPRRLFVAHRRLLLISEDAARRGIKQEIDELSRNPESRLRTNVAITEGRAIDFMKVLYPFERVPAEGLRQIIFGEQTDYRLDMRALSEMLVTPGSQAIVPIAQLRPRTRGGKPSFKMNGMAVLRDGKMIGRLSEHQARGVLWLRKEMRRATIIVDVPNQAGHISCQLLRAQTDYEVTVNRGHPEMTLHIEPENDVFENNSTLNLTRPRDVTYVERLLSQSVTASIENTLHDLQKKYHADVVEFGQAVQRAYPREWQEWSRNWDREFSTMKVHVKVDGKIRRVGMTGQSLDRP